MFEHVRLISFDLDDTLWPCAPVIAAAEKACHAWLAVHAPRLTARYSPDAQRKHRIELARREPRIAHDLTEVRRRSLASLLESTGYPAPMAHAANDVFRAVRNQVAPYADVIDSLNQLRARYPLVSVTNGNAQIEHTPLRTSFDLSLTAAEVGAAKPDPALFHVASRHFGVPLDQCLHVGDDPHRDVAAARNVGISTVWLNRGDWTWPDEVPRADLEIGHLGCLVDTLLGTASRASYRD